MLLFLCSPASALLTGMRGTALPRASPIQMQKLPLDFLTLHTTYVISDAEAVMPLTEEFIGLVKSETGVMYAGWDFERSKESYTSIGGYASVSGDRLFCRQAYADADSLLRHLNTVKPCVDKLLAGPASMGSVVLHGPSAELAKCAAANAQCFEARPDGHSRIKKVSGGMPLPIQNCPLVHSTFTVADWAAAEPLVAAYTAATAKEGGCIYSGFSRQGSSLFLREAFSSVTDIVKHVENAGDAMDALLAGATLEACDVHTGRENVKTLRTFLAETGRVAIYGKEVEPVCLWKGQGVQTYEVQQSLFGFSF